MSNTSDFVIENGVLTKYTGPGGDVVIPDGVTGIGNSAFQYCNSLTGITIPNSVTYIGKNAFFRCANLTGIAIPDSVTDIGAWAFHGCIRLTDILIADGVKEIGDFAFGDCSSLTSVTIPGSVTRIGASAFRNCGSLTSITIPDGAPSIEDRAFQDCKNLVSVTVSPGVSKIDSLSFYGTAFVRDPANWEDDVLYIGNMLHKANRTISGHYTVKAGTTGISQGAFYQCALLTGITLPDGVLSIGQQAFQECSGLTDMTIPKSVKSIGYLAFERCTGLTSITIQADAVNIDEKTFGGCTGLTRIISNTKLTKEMFGKYLPYKPIFTNDPGVLPSSLKPLAAMGYAEDPAEPGSEREKTHLKYIKSNVSKLGREALSHPALLRLMCDNKFLNPQMTELYLAAAQQKGNAEITAMLMDYRENKLTGKEKEKAEQKAAAREDKVTDFIFSATAMEQLQGKVFVVTGKLNTFTSRDEFKACLDACGAILSETLNENTNYLITNTPESGSAKNKKAEKLGVKKLSEAEFNRLIGREQTKSRL